MPLDDPTVRGRCSRPPGAPAASLARAPPCPTSASSPRRPAASPATSPSHPADRAAFDSTAAQERAAQRRGPRGDARPAGRRSPTRRPTRWTASASNVAAGSTPSPASPQTFSATWPGSTPPPATASSASIVNNARRARRADLRQRPPTSAGASARRASNEASLVRVLAGRRLAADPDAAGQGTLGMLASDSTLYRETTRRWSQLREAAGRHPGQPARSISRFSVF